ncbi:hypothetical protein V8F20_004160 [Naviculisporaceae sp. PSN 640]
MQALPMRSIPRRALIPPDSSLGGSNHQVVFRLWYSCFSQPVRLTEGSRTNRQAPFHRGEVDNIHFSITEEELRTVFSHFREFATPATGFEPHVIIYHTHYTNGFVQFHKAAQAKDVLEEMNGFEHAGRPNRVGLGNDKFTPESTANLMQGLDDFQ